jgi:hypothetical protein
VTAQAKSVRVVLGEEKHGENMIAAMIVAWLLLNIAIACVHCSRGIATLAAKFSGLRLV